MAWLQRLIDELAPPPGRESGAPGGDAELRDATRGPTLAEARESLSYWQDRLHRLPRRRLAARREARAMIARWRERVDVAHLERWRGSTPYRLAGALGIDSERMIVLARRRARTVSRVIGLTLVTFSAAVIAVTAAVVLALAGV